MNRIVTKFDVFEKKTCKIDKKCSKPEKGTPEYQQYKIAKDTLKMSDEGEMSKEEAKKFLAKYGVNEAKVEKWMQSAGKNKGKLHKKMGIKEGDVIPIEKIESEITRLQDKYTKKDKKFSKKDLKYFRELQAAKNMKNN